MKYLAFLFLSVGLTAAHADISFDPWNFEELVVTGLKAARRGDSAAEDHVLSQLRTSLAQLNLDINRSHPKDLEAAVAAARELLAARVKAAWTTEADQPASPAQLRFMDQVYAAGSGDTIAVETNAAGGRWIHEHWGSGVLLRDVAAMAGTTLAIAGTVIPSAIHFGVGPVAVFGLVPVICVWGIGCDLLPKINRKRIFAYRANVISPVLRECELALKSGTESPR